MKVLKYPNKKLLTKSTDVADMREAAIIVFKLKEAMAEQTWGAAVGFAAPQIGINKRVFIACGEVFINPLMAKHEKGGEARNREGCYSLVDNKFDYPVMRSRAVRITWRDLDGVQHVKNFAGFKSKVIQHEYDHIEGKLCYDA